ncbi:MAG TPA: PilZ domain-containing protein [Anaerolineales bacterium]|nr:PilZ domain-containing protein [Anaerolineales bacterium]
MTTIEQIIHDLKQIADVGETIELLNTYKGLPIVNKASFEKIDGGAITLKTQPHQLTCLSLEQRAVLLSDILQIAIRADVTAIDKAAGTVTLANFTVTSQKVGDRMTVRVEPREPYPVDFSAQNQTAPAALADISINGLGLHMPGAPLALKRRSKVQLTFQLPNAEISAAGEVRYVKQEPDGQRVGIDFSQDVRIKALVAQYISGRRSEILDELDRA